MNPWENLRLMYAFAQRYPTLEIRFLQWLNQYRNTSFTFHRKYLLAKILGEAEGWPQNFHYCPVILERPYPKEKPTGQAVCEVGTALISAVVNAL
jgi:hypothetical protein